jgi:hypothetical protein
VGKALLVGHLGLQETRQEGPFWGYQDLGPA